MYSELWLESPFSNMFIGTPAVTATVFTNTEGAHIYNKSLDVSNWGERYLTVHYRYTFASKMSGKPLLYAGDTYTFTASGLAGSLAVQGQEEVLYRAIYYNQNELTSVYVIYINGQSEVITGNYFINTIDENATLKTKFEPKYDVRSISFELRAKDPMGFLSTPSWAVIETGGVDGFSVVIDKKEAESEESLNFFEKILKKVQAFRDDVKESLRGASDERRGMWETLKDTLTKITEMPWRMWSYIKNGLQSLFIPDEAFMKQWVEKNRQWCTETFGALYQSFDLIINAYTNIDASAETHFIEVPEVTIPLPDNQEFTFGGYSVRIVPEGFEYIASVCKAVVGIICTFAFINGMRRRYDDIMEETK